MIYALCCIVLRWSSATEALCVFPIHFGTLFVMFFLLRIVFGNPLSTIIIAPIEYQSDNWWLEVSVSSVVDCRLCALCCCRCRFVFSPDREPFRYDDCLSCLTWNTGLFVGDLCHGSVCGGNASATGVVQVESDTTVDGDIGVVPVVQYGGGFEWYGQHFRVECVVCVARGMVR